MKRLARVFGAICGVGFVVLLAVMIFNMVQGTPGVSYGAMAIVLALLALGMERFGRE
jgi:hypothetical protein